MFLKCPTDLVFEPGEVDEVSNLTTCAQLVQAGCILAGGLGATEGCNERDLIIRRARRLEVVHSHDDVQVWASQ